MEIASAYLVSICSMRESGGFLACEPWLQSDVVIDNLGRVMQLSSDLGRPSLADRLRPV